MANQYTTKWIRSACHVSARGDLRCDKGIRDPLAARSRESRSRRRSAARWLGSLDSSGEEIERREGEESEHPLRRIQGITDRIAREDRSHKGGPGRSRAKRKREGTSEFKRNYSPF